MFSKEKVEVRYYSMKDIIDSVKYSQECGIMERAFDWDEIAIKSLRSKRCIIKACRAYGKVRRVKRGFVIKFNY